MTILSRRTRAAKPATDLQRHGDGGVAAPTGVRGATVVLLVVVLFAAAALAWMTTRPGPADSLAVKTAPIVQSAVISATGAERPAQVQLTFDPGTTSPAPNWQGLVTSVAAKKGSVISNGLPLLSIDGVTRLAVATPMPFYRPLSTDDRGADVDQLCKVLAALSYLDRAPSAGTPYGGDVARAVGTLAAQLGVPGAKANQPIAFDPAWFVWVSKAGLTLQSISAVTGQQAPAPGQALLTFAPTLTSAVVSSANDLGSVVSDIVTTPDGTQIAVHDGDLALDANTRAALARGIADSVPGTAPDADSGQGSGAPGDASAPDSTPTVRVMRRTVWRQPTAQIPAAAVVTRTDGSMCVVTVAGRSYHPVTVTVIASDTSTSAAYVQGLADGSDVVVNPAESNLAHTCAGTS